MDRPTREQVDGAMEIATYDSGYVWPIRASEVFVEDTVLCGASLHGGQMCIRQLTDDLQCPRHGQRKATRRTPPGTSAPLPAVPDGEDAPPHLVQANAPAMRKLLARVSSGEWTPADAEDVLMDWPNRAEVDGEDVPARLDAAADACANLRERPESREAGTLLRRLASWLKHAEAVEVRAAVAAALARPTEPRT